MSPLFPILTTNPVPSNLFYTLWPDPASKYTSDHITVSLQNSKCKSLSSVKKSILLTQVSEVLRNVVPTSPSVLFPTDASPLERVRSHHSLKWPHISVSLKLLLLFRLSAVHTRPSASIKVYSLLREHFQCCIFQKEVAPDIFGPGICRIWCGVCVCGGVSL